MKFVIVTTRSTHGGNVVLRELCRLLASRGFDARILAYQYPDVDHPTNRLVLSAKSVYYLLRDCGKWLLEKMGLKENFFQSQPCRKQCFPFIGEDTVVVYPASVFGNPLHAKNVVRWFLFHNQYSGLPDACGKNDLFFSFREFFNDYRLNPECRLLTVLFFDSKFYRQYNFAPRQGVCYIVRKGYTRKDLPRKWDGPIVDDLPEREKVAVFNRCKYCFDYDTQTFYASIAAVCGCIPVVVMEPGKTKQDYLGRGDSDNGRAYGDGEGEIARAIKTRADLVKSLDFREENERNVTFFLEEVEKRFGNGLKLKAQPGAG